MNKKILKISLLIKLKVIKLINYVEFYNLKIVLEPSKINRVIQFIEDAAERQDYDDFARYMFSVSLIESTLQFNYIHPLVAVANVTPSLRPIVKNFFNRLFKFESCTHLMNWAKQSLTELDLEPIDENVPIVSLTKWENVVRRLTFLVLQQTKPPR